MYHFWDYWQLYHKCVFDGVNKLIFVTPGVTDLDIKTDVYSDWKEWFRIYDYAKYSPAIRTIGGDPLGGGVFAGDLYFLINGWRLVIDFSKTKVTGALFSDDYDSPFVTPDLVIQYPATVSNLVQTVVTTNTIPVVEGTPSSIASAVRTELQSNFNQLSTEISQIDTGLTEAQATMLLEIYRLYGLDPTKPLVVTKTSRTAGDINQIIDSNDTRTIVTRQ